MISKSHGARCCGRSAPGRPPTSQASLAQAGRLGFDLASGAVAIVRASPAASASRDERVAAASSRSARRRRRRAGPRAGAARPPRPRRRGRRTLVATGLQRAGMEVGVSAPRRDPAALHEALREAELLVELARQTAASIAGPGGDLPAADRRAAARAARSSSCCASARSRRSVAYDAEHDTELRRDAAGVSRRITARRPRPRRR